MTPSAVTNFASYAANESWSFEKDRQTNGAPQAHPYESQRAGDNGPLLLQDFHLIDLLSHFDHERIPERVVHTKGSGAHGFFECTDPIPDIRMADLFSERGKRCPITVRFSTVGGESGSHDCVAVKFTTGEGNWDMVANNTPVFFQRDPAKFPEFIHTQKRDPATHLTHADDSTMFWDYLGIPDGYRKTHGCSGHALKFVNKDGDWVYTQIHFRSRQGTGFITQEDSVNKSPDYSQKDLYEAIQRGDYPKWDVKIQMATAQQAEEMWEEQRINVFDLTHVWPQGRFPLRKIGELTLNENAINYFAEIEQVAFSPSHLVPGIEPSADPVLQSRLFSYSDTHRHRVGPNYQQLPVNAPRTAVPDPTYLSSIDSIRFQRRKVDLDKTHGHSIGQAASFLSEIRPEDFRAPRALWQKVFDEPARERFISNVAHKMSLCKDEEILKRQIAIFREVDADIAARLEKATRIRGYDGIANLAFNGTHNGMASSTKTRYANGVSSGQRMASCNGAPYARTHKPVMAMGVDGVASI
ncbi:catalase-like domain-containing protein [Nemania abortiva]|nr:catalase-like domain-containing protein [Nemania abortiva]